MLLKDQFVCQLSAVGILKQVQYDKQDPPDLSPRLSPQSVKGKLQTSVV